VAGSNDSIFSRNPACAWMRGRNSLLSAFLNSYLSRIDGATDDARKHCLPPCWMGLKRDVCYPKQVNPENREPLAYRVQSVGES